MNEVLEVFPKRDIACPLTVECPEMLDDRHHDDNCGDGVHPANLTGTVTKQEIMDEREREFALEGERFFDLVRWNEAYNVMNDSRMEWWDASFNSLIYHEKNDFFPLPAIETAKNSNLKQYAGW